MLECKIKYKYIQNIIIYFLFFLVIIPYDTDKIFLNKLPYLSTMLLYCIRLLMVFYAFGLVLQKKQIESYQKKVIKRVTIYFALVFVINMIAYLTSTENNYNILIRRALSIACVYSFLIIVIYNSRNIETIMSSIKFTTLFLVIFSIVLYLFFPSIGKYQESMEKYTFLGIAENRNGYIEFALMLIISIFYLYPNKINIFNKIIIIITLITIYMTSSATSIIITLGSMLMMIYVYIFNKKINFNRIFMIISLIWIAFTILIYIGGSFNFIGHIFGKSGTLTGRTIIWSKTMEYIKEKPMVGYSFDNRILANTYAGSNQKYFNTNNAHNSLLYILISSGIIGTIVTVVFFIISLKTNKNNCDIKYSYIYIYIVAAMIRGFTESCLQYSHVLLYVMLIIVSLYNEQKNELNNNTREEKLK